MWEFLVDNDKQMGRAICTRNAIVTLSDVQLFNAKLTELAATLRSRFGVIRLMTDARTLLTQSPDIAQHFKRPDVLLQIPDDRYALVLGSSLSKLQAKRVLGDDKRIQAFLSFESAEAWLLDHRNES